MAPHHPVPKGYKSGPAGEIVRQGTGGRLAVNLEMDEGKYDAHTDRTNPGDCYDLQTSGEDMDGLN